MVGFFFSGFLDFLSFLHVFAMPFFLVAAVSSDLSHLKLLGLCAVPADLRGLQPWKTVVYHLIEDVFLCT